MLKTSSDDSMKKSISANQRLHSLPKIFRGNDLVLAGIPEKYVSIYLGRWKSAGLIDSLGGRSDVFFNSLCYGREAWVEEAILDLSPGAIQIGIGPLHRHAWTTQIPQKIEVAVPSKYVFSSQHATFYSRSIRWFKATTRGVEDQLSTPICSLRPAWALADSWLTKNPNVWKPDPDDLDFFEMEPLLDEFVEAFQVLSPVYRNKIELSNSRDFYMVYSKMRESILNYHEELSVKSSQIEFSL
ncbi:MAG TPA: hypothetical protein VIY47_01300 [Ignavibacteriaceae bacterium]